MAVGDRRWTFLLQPTGKVDVLARVERTADDTFVFDVDAGYGDALVARLDRFKIRVKADVERLPWNVVLRVGAAPTSSGPMRRRRTACARARRPSSRRPASPTAGRRWVPRSCPARRSPPRPGVTAVAVDFRKGCYPGQELVERMDSRGGPATRPAHRRRGDPARRRATASSTTASDVGVLTSVAGRSPSPSSSAGRDVGRVPVH